MTIKQISKYLLNELKPFGAIKWHVSKHGSIYIKFKDCRLGSIRIADHLGRQKYGYKYNLTDKSKQHEIDKLVRVIKQSSEMIYDFNPKAYVVYSTKYHMYTKVDSYDEYKEIILKKKEI